MKCITEVVPHTSPEARGRDCHPPTLTRHWVKTVPPSDDTTSLSRHLRASRPWSAMEKRVGLSSQDTQELEDRCLARLGDLLQSRWGKPMPSPSPALWLLPKAARESDQFGEHQPFVIQLAIPTAHPHDLSDRRHVVL